MTDQDGRRPFATDTIAIFGLGLLVFFAAFPLWGLIARPLVRAAARAGEENIGLFFVEALYPLLVATVATGVGYFAFVYRPKSPRRPTPGTASWARATGYAILVTVTAVVLPGLAVFILFGVL